MPLLLPNFSFMSISYVQFTSTLSVKCTFSSIPNKALSQGMAVVQGTLQGRAGQGQHSLEDERHQSNGFHRHVVLLVQRHGHNAVLQGSPRSVRHKHSKASRWKILQLTEKLLLGRKMFQLHADNESPSILPNFLMYPLAALCKNRNKCFSSPDPCVFARKGGGDWRATALFWLGSI